ncbi:MAG TPA: DUF3137 domain-containing protein [Sulfurospirillum arcachonense]|nr:DUF3137 domain-containing protein [Sulfurospirillum arcachonense]
MKTLSSLQDFFYENIYPDLEFLEQKRVEIYASLKRIVIVIFILTCTFFYMLYDVIPNTSDLLILCCIIPFGIFTFIYKMKVSGYASLFKDQVIERLVEFIGDTLTYKKLGFISEYEYKTSALFPQKVDRYSGDDLVVGKVDGVDVRFSEIHSEVKKKGNKGKTYWLTIFRGLFFVADFNKHFKGKTVILPDNSEKFLGSFSHFFQSFSSRGELVKMDSPEFEKEFVVYSDDQIEARYILSHSLMDSILKYKKLVGKNISISFVGSNIYIAIGFKQKLFEPKIYKKVTSFDEVRFYFEILSLTSDIVKHLNLDIKIWSKR